MYMEEIQENGITCQNGWDSYLNYDLLAEDKVILGIGFWEFKEEEDNSYGDGKAKIW